MPKHHNQRDEGRSLDVIHAPYNFVPLSDWVHCPEDGDKANHDLPFADGVSGEIPYTLIAETPVLVGGLQDKADEHRPGQVHFVQTPDGPAVPGSSIRGMLRAVVEIAAFGRMRFVDDARYGLRDISKSDTPYSRKIRGKVQTGFLSRDADGMRRIAPCGMVRVEHRDLEAWLGVPKTRRDHRRQQELPNAIFRERWTVHQKYEEWGKLTKMKGVPADRVRFDTESDRAVNLGHGSREGVPVFTGQIDDSTTRFGKKRDFLFHSPRDAEEFGIRDADWRAFLLIHGDEDGKRDMSWPGYWRSRFNQDEKIPVFYLDDGKDGEGNRKVRIGLAYMPKLAWDFSVEQLIGHKSVEHLRGPERGGAYDMADLLFGALGADPASHLKGRVYCGLAAAQGQPVAEHPASTILNGPKPTYFPNYIKQSTDGTTGRLSNGAEYATCIETPRNRRPELRGFKRYPARSEAKVQQLTEEQRTSPRKNVQVKLHPLPAGTSFQGLIRFHNLRPWELGALVWAITWGGNDVLRHGLGMGKPFGYGQVRFRPDWQMARIMSNADIRGSGPMVDPQPWRQQFLEHMEDAWSAQGRNGSWQTSEQLCNLLAMADPARADSLPNGMELRHMRLEAKKINEFQLAKQAEPAPLTLVDYARATGDGRASRRGVAGAPSHPWLRAKRDELVKAHNAKPDDIIGGKALANAWQQIEDPEEKAAVLAAIKADWQARGWWDKPPGRSKRHAKTIYEG